MMREREIQMKQEKKERQKRQIAALSFRLDDEEEGDDEDEDDEEDKEKEENIKSENEDSRDLETETSEREIKPEISKIEINPPQANENSCSSIPDIPLTNIKREFLSSEDSSSACSDFGEDKPRRKKKIRKNPDVDTSFLPDREREEEEMRLREELRLEWVQKQEKLKNEEISITFSYWDGSGHRRSVKMKKGNSIYQFLQVNILN